MTQWTRRGGPARWGAGAVLALAILVGAPPCLAEVSELQHRAAAHLEAAVEGGLRPADFHHLLFALGWRDTLPDWNWTHVALDRLAAAGSADPLMADELRLVRAQVALAEGRPAAARELFRSMGGLERWWALGPVELEELEDFEAVAALPGDGAQWRAVPGVDPLGWVRVDGLAWPSQRQLLYLATTVVSEVETEVAMRVGAAAAARVWLNGDELLTTPSPLERAEDQFSAGGRLRAGSNLVVAAVAVERDEWWFRARMTRPDGAPVSGLREVDNPPRSVEARDGPAVAVRDLGEEIRAAVAAGEAGAALAWAAYLVIRHPEPTGTGAVREACREARSVAPGEARLLEWLRTSEPGTARELLEEAVELDPELHWARIALASWLEARDLFQDAHELLAEGLAEPTVAAAVLDLDAARWGPLMLKGLQDLAAAHPSCVEVWTVLASRALDSGHLEMAGAAVARLMELVPGAPPVIELKERLASRLGDGEELQRIATQLLDLDPNRANLRVRLARLLVAVGDPEGARRELRVGLDRCPEHPELTLELARVQHGEGHDQEAVSLVRALLEVRPQEARARRLLRLLAGEQEDRGWSRTPEELWRLADSAPAPEDEPAIGLLERHEMSFLPGNLIEERVQRVVLISNARQADGLRQHTIAYVPERQRLRVLSARRLRRGQAEVSARQRDTPRLSEPALNLFYDTRLRLLSFQDLEDGELVEISYILSETAESNDTGPYKGGLIVLGADFPQRRVEVELVGRAELLPQWQLHGIGGEPERLVDAEGKQRLSWTWEGLEPQPADMPAPPPLTVTPYLTFSNHPEWAELAGWYERHVAPRVTLSRQVEETARELVRDLDDRREQIAAIYRFVANKIRYVGLELGEHRFRPFSADWVLSHRMGDCKDKAALLVALFGAVGIEARMVLIRTADQGPFTGDLAILEAFNHAIAFLPEDDLWLDGTAAGHDPFVPPGGDQGASVLVIDGPTSSLGTLPATGAGLARREVLLRRGEGAELEVTVRAVDSGDAAGRLRARLAGTQDPRRFARWLQQLFPGADLVGEPEIVLPPSRDPATVEVEGTVARAALLSAGGVRVYPGKLDLVTLFAPGESRSTPLLLPTRPELQWTLEVDLGRPPVDLPESTDLGTDFGRLQLELIVLPTGYRVEGAFHLEPGMLDPGELPGLRAFLVAVDRALDQRLEVP